ncbi:MAG: hypothetical protein HYR84_00710 [Planctomycetes bacterium]|nr:hypothetical protein [Planctomycetota bacterium]
MSLVCAQCSRVNPPEAFYCHYDGAALAGRSGGPLNAGAAPFPNPFVFPDGLACRNFDQLGLACQQNWASAISLLQQGYLGSFFGGMGRVDLAMAAQEAAKFPDLDRGLDQLLAKLPTQALQAPKVNAEPSEINIGQIKLGENRAIELHLVNQGMRLLYGTVTSDCEWLTLGDAPGHSQKLFQFSVETTITVQIRGQHLRAGAKPIEGHLTIDSNGGEPITVTIRADVPITPYPDAPFAGAVTPRQICETAKKNVKQAIPLFERGDIALWYAKNGWKYPVQGPLMEGKGSIQQFFEALGVGKPPRVDFTPKALDLAGAVGKTIDAAIEITTADKKVVYGYATCDQPWVEVGKTKPGRSDTAVTVPITIRVPNPCPPTLEATIQAVGNGNQKAAIPLKIKVAGGKAGVVLAPVEEELPPIEIIDDEVPIVVIDDGPAPSAPPPIPQPVAIEAIPIMVLDEPAPMAPKAPAPVPVPTPVAPGPPPPPVQAIDDASPFAIPETPGDTASIPKPPERLPLPLRLMLHMIPVGVLFICLIVLLVHDIWFSAKAASADNDPIDPRPYIELVFDEGRRRDEPHHTDSMMFAVHRIDPANKAAKAKLNYYENGFGNSVVLKIDGLERAFGNSPEHGIWAIGYEKGKFAQSVAKEGPGGKTRIFDMNGIYVTQTATIEPGEPFLDPETKTYKRRLDTCLVRYKIENKDPSMKKHNVGLRILMDTYIGDNDGVPFTLPGVHELVTTKHDFKGEDVPDFVQVLQNSDKETALRDPGIVMQLNLRISDKLEAPSRFLLTRYPGKDKQKLHKWEVPVVDMDDDSAVVIYWEERDLAPGKPRELAFTYGLGTVAVAENSKIGLTFGGATYVHGDFTVVALISDPAAKSASIELPDGLRLLDAKTKKQEFKAAAKNRPTPVTWRVRAEKEGRYNVSVSTNTNAEQARRVTISAKSLFN